MIGNRSSAFEVYRKPTVSRNSQSPHDAPNNINHNNVNNNINNNTNINTIPCTNTMDYEKRVIAISDNLRLVRIKPGETMSDVLKHLKEQNHLLLRLCNDLSEELLGVQYKREELRMKIETASGQQQISNL